MPDDRLGAFSLPTVLVICVLMALILFSAITFADLDRQSYALYHRQKQQILDMHSALAKYSVDSTRVSPGDSTDVVLFDKKESGVTVSVKRWGLYEVAAIRSKHVPIVLSQLVGKAVPSRADAALYVADRNRPLSFAGTTGVTGSVYAPQSGINYTELMGVPYTGREIEDGDNHVSRSMLPPLDSTVFSYLDSLIRMRPKAWYHLNVPQPDNSFLVQTSLAYSRNADETFNMSGNRILYADDLLIKKDSKLDGVLVFARSAVVEDGFEGCMQLFCTDSIVLGRNAHLRSPSGLYVSNEDIHPCITMRRGSRVDGYVVALTGGREDMTLDDPCLRQDDDTVVEGLVYVDGTARVSGRVHGSAYLRDCFYVESEEKYPGVLYNCDFAQAEDVVYPVLMKGPYRRRAIKKVY